MSDPIPEPDDQFTADMVGPCERCRKVEERCAKLAEARREIRDVIDSCLREDTSFIDDDGLLFRMLARIDSMAAYAPEGGEETAR